MRWRPTSAVTSGSAAPPRGRGWLRADLVAGVTVTAYLIPQVMAYAELAGLPPVTGLWASVGALAGYALLGSSRQLSVGPESTTAIMTAAVLVSVPSAAADPTTFAAVLAIVVGVMCLIGWVARVSVVTELLSRPVLVGYLCGIAVIMVVSQLGKVLKVATSEDAVVARVTELARLLPDAHLPTLLLATATLVLMFAGSAKWPHAPVTLVGMLAATAGVVLFDLAERGVLTVGEIASAVPPPGLPALDLSAVPSLLAPALGIAFVGYTDNVLTARAFAERHHERIDPSRELLALGMSNIGAGLLHGFPVSSSGSRTAIADAVGARTRMAGVFTLLATVVAVFAARPVLESFPIAALGAVVIFAAVKLVDVGELRRFARFRRSELVLALATTLAVLVLGVLLGVVAAIALSILDLLRQLARPHDAVQGEVPGLPGYHDIDDYPVVHTRPGLLLYRYDSPLFFANAENFRTRALAAVAASPEPVEWFLLNVEAVSEVDITAVDALESLRAELSGQGIVFGLARVKQDLRDSLRPSGILERIGDEHLFLTIPTALEAYLAWRAVHRPGTASPDTQEA